MRKLEATVLFILLAATFSLGFFSADYFNINGQKQAGLTT